MSKAKGRVQREGRVVQMPPARELEAASDHVAEETTESTVRIHLGVHDRVIQRMVVGAWKQVVDFSLTQQTWLNDVWQDVIRFDCAHGTVHSHTFLPDGREVRQEFASLDGLESTCEAVLEKLYDGWEERRRRYRRG